jgi:hypothetical protein
MTLGLIAVITSIKQETMSQLLPRSIDNNYRGSRIALWIFGLLVLVRTLIGVNSMWMGRTVASTADGIPLDTYGAPAAQTIVSLFATLGLANVMISLLCILALIRYRAMVPLMLAVLLLQQSSRYLILYFLPIVRVGTPPGTFVNLGLFTLMIVGLALSLKGPNTPTDSHR